MSIIFRYVHVPRPDGTLRKAPYIPIFSRDRNGKLVRIVALVDSGADDTVVPKDLSIILGLKEHEESDTGGIGGKVKARKSRLSFEIRGSRETYHLDVPVLILQDQSSDVPLLLGRHGFFENFHVIFKQDEEKMILKKINPKVRY